MREAGVRRRGIDLSAESVAVCRGKGLEAETADLFAYLGGLPEAALDGIFCAQVVEHLPPERLPDDPKLCASRLTRGGVIAIETPNPECLAIFATYFYLDPTHTRPVPPSYWSSIWRNSAWEVSGCGNWRPRGIPCHLWIPCPRISGRPSSAPGLRHHRQETVAGSPAERFQSGGEGVPDRTWFCG